MNIRANLRYLRTVLRHKLYVIQEGRKIGVDWPTLIVHDLSKFHPAEWPAYVERFESGRAGKEDKNQDTGRFRAAWRHHYMHNPHHWEFWIVETWATTRLNKKNMHIHLMLKEADLHRPTLTYEIPRRFVLEMIADWRAASRAYSGKRDCIEWYLKTRDRQIMHPNTRRLVEELLGIEG